MRGPDWGLVRCGVLRTGLSFTTLIRTGAYPDCWRTAGPGPRATLTRDSGLMLTRSKACGSRSCWIFFASFPAAFRPSRRSAGSGAPRKSRASRSRSTLAARGWPSTSTGSWASISSANITLMAPSSIQPHPNLKPSRGRDSGGVAVLDAHQIMARSLVLVNGLGIAVRRVHVSISVRLDRDRRRSVAEIPGLPAFLVAERADLEHHRIVRPDPERRSIRRVDRRRGRVRVLLVENLHHLEVVIDMTLDVGDFQDLAIAPRLRVRLPERGQSAQVRAVRKDPLVAQIPSLGLGAVQIRGLPRPDQRVRTGHRGEGAGMLLERGLPEEGVAVLDAPEARRLAARDVQMEVRPSPAAALLADDAELLAHRDAGARPDRRFDVLEMAVPVIPAPRVEQVDHVVARLDGLLLSGALEHFLARRHDEAVRGGHHVDQAFRTADVEAVVVVDLLLAGQIAAVDVDRLVGHVREAGEPALAGGILEGAGGDPGRSRRPDSEARILEEAPDVLAAALLDVPLGDRAIDLDRADRHRQMVGPARERQLPAVDLDPDLRHPDRAVDVVQGFLEVEQLDADRPVAHQGHVLGFADRQVRADVEHHRLPRGLPGRTATQEQETRQDPGPVHRSLPGPTSTRPDEPPRLPWPC